MLKEQAYRPGKSAKHETLRDTAQEHSIQASMAPQSILQRVTSLIFTHISSAQNMSFQKTLRPVSHFAHGSAQRLIGMAGQCPYQPMEATLGGFCRLTRPRFTTKFQPQTPILLFSVKASWTVQTLLGAAAEIKPLVVLI